MPRKKKTQASGAVSDYRHEDAKRKNNPPAGLAAHGKAPAAPKLKYAYDPHLPPRLRFDPTGRAEYLDELIGRAVGGQLSEEDGALLRELLGSGAPWLEWTGKREAQEFVVDPVALHIHERISTQAILAAAKRQDVQKDFFADPQQELRDAIRFYEHDVDWANRMILGDSLQVMASLAHREDLAGKVQMIYMDPPYGIRFASNFQPEIGRRDVKDKDSDLTREPEMVKAYRDTWTLGVHSYLSYLRDRLVLARELLTDSGSIFVQISDENLHRVRLLLDEVFGPENALSQISFVKTSSATSEYLPATADYLVWYARNKELLKYRPPLVEASADDRTGYRWLRLSDGSYRGMTKDETPESIPASALIYKPDNITSSRPPGSFPVSHDGKTYTPAKSYWKTSEEGMGRLSQAGRLHVAKNSIQYIRYADDFPARQIANVWTDTGTGNFTDDKVYVVQTGAKVVQRCLLMTTDPGDLVLDPTCGSGTTAYVAEQWGRRWITVDTSRVALALARQRLMTATFPHYVVPDDDASDGRANPGRGFRYRTVPHIMLKSIAQNVALDPIFERHRKVLDARLAALNAALSKHATPELRKTLKAQFDAKQKAEGKRAITDADRRRWLLPDAEWREWEVPFDADDDWPKPLRDALFAYRNAWRAKMDEVNATIAASADQEELVDQPEIEKGVVRVTGPFTMEAVMPVEQSDADAASGFVGEQADDLDSFDATTPDEAVNAEGFVDRMLGLLTADGVRFPSNRTLAFERLDRIDGGVALQGEGEWRDGEGKTRRVVISIGPEHGPVTSYQVEEALREANRRGADDLVFAGFSFDGAAQAAIQEDQHPRVRAHLAHIAPDVQMGDLLKTTKGSQLFSVFGLPRVELRNGRGDEYRVEMQGVDIYDPVANTIHATRADKVAAWFLDTDYDGRTFCIAQAFFPDRKAWDKLERALRGTIDADRFEELTGTSSLPFRAGKHKRIAVKVIDPRGNEVMRVVRLNS